MRYLFYALFSETKSKELEMKGPYVHMKPSETVQTEFERYIMSEQEVSKECKYLTAKFSNSVIIFKIMAMDTQPENNDSDLEANGLTPEENRFISDLFAKAESYFKGKFELMSDNYKICSK